MSKQDTIHGYCIECQAPKEADSYECPDCGAELAIKPSQIPSQKLGQSLDPLTIYENIENSDRPFATVSDIAEWADVSERTVLNNEDDFLSGKITKETVGKANVYYPADN